MFPAPVGSWTVMTRRRVTLQALHPRAHLFLRHDPQIAEAPKLSLDELWRTGVRSDELSSTP